MKRVFALIALFGILLCGCGAAGGAEETQETTLPKNIMQKEAPAGDDIMNILFIGDSTCYYWTDELYGMLAAAGYEDANVCNLYYSGCTPEMYWNWHQEGAAKLEFFTVNRNGRQKLTNYTLEMALRMQNWDIISFKTSSGEYNLPTNEEALATTEPYLTNLLEYVRSQYPLSSYYWQQNWAVEIGYSNGRYTMADRAQRDNMYSNTKYVAQEVAKKHNLTIVPCGDAWEPVRDLELFRTTVEHCPLDAMTLCSRIQGNQIIDDFGHDGDIGGGQYLSACVWYEMITGQCCLENTFRPQYMLGGIDFSLTEEKIQVLQKAAHDAVAAAK